MKTPMTVPGRRRNDGKPDSQMTSAEKETLIEQIEEFEGPSRREKRGTETVREHPPGVSGS